MRIFLLIILGSWSLWMRAQSSDSLYLDIHYLDTDALPSGYARGHSDAAALQKTLQAFLSTQQLAGYLTVSVDSLLRRDSVYQALVWRGPKFKWLYLENGNLPVVWWSRHARQGQIFEAQVVRQRTLAQLQEKLLQEAENSGYPFAQVYVDSVVVAGEEVAARLYWASGPLITFSPLKVLGSTGKDSSKVRISKRFLSNYLGIRSGAPYNEKLIRRIEKRVRELPYLKALRSTQVLFVEAQAEPVLFLRNQQASSFDFILGVQPNDPQLQNGSTAAPNPQRRLTLTGDVKIDLLNPFGTGKRFLLRWQQLRPQTSEFEIRTQLPYLFNSPLGIDAAFEIYRRDSLFTEVITEVGFQYLFQGSNYLKAFWQRNQTNALYLDTLQLLRTRQLPDNIDVQRSTYGLEFYGQYLDYRYNPRAGFEAKARVGFTLKRIPRSSDITGVRDPNAPEYDFAQLYDSLPLQNVQYQLALQLAYYWPLWRQQTLKMGFQGAAIFSEGRRFQSEQFRFGGSQLLRGFDEQSLLGDMYGVFTLEWRYLVGTHSYFYLFGDYAYYENTLEALSDRPLGFGAGIALETQVGIFGLSYALGKQRGNPILFRNAKIHFGYLNRF